MRKASDDNYLEILKARIKKRTPLHREQALAEEIWLFLLKEVPFPAILQMIREKGYQAVYEIFNDVRKADFPNKPALFLSLVKKEKVLWFGKGNFKAKDKK